MLVAEVGVGLEEGAARKVSARSPGLGEKQGDVGRVLVVAPCCGLLDVVPPAWWPYRSSGPSGAVGRGGCGAAGVLRPLL